MDTTANSELPERTRSLLAEAREADPEDNERTTPPAGEKVRLPCIWVFETYLPGEASQLLERIRGLGWDKPDPYRGTGDLNKWFRSARTYGTGGFSLGRIGAKGTRVDHELELPPGVEYVRADLGQMTPSVTLMGCQFILDEATARSLETLLHRSFETTVEKTERGYAFPGPSVHRARAVNRSRKEIRERCSGWLQKNFPGSFAAGLLDGEFPSGEFVTLELGLPLHGDDTDWRGTYLSTLGIGRAWDVWESEKLLGVRLAMPSNHEEGNPHNLVFAARMSDLLTEKDHDKRSVLWRMDEHVGWVIGTWTLSKLLEGHEKRLAELRDKALTIGPGDESGTISQLRQIERDMTSLARSTPFLAAELGIRFSEKDYWYSEAYDFKPMEEHRPKLPLVKAMRDYMVSRAKRVREVEADVRQGILITSNLLNASANEKVAQSNLSLQRRIFWLTIAAFAVAIVSLSVAVF